MRVYPNEKMNGYIYILWLKNDKIWIWKGVPATLNFAQKPRRRRRKIAAWPPARIWRTVTISRAEAVMCMCLVWAGLYTTTSGGPRVVVSTAAFHARVRGSVPGLGGLKETKMFLPHPRVKVSIVGSLRDREVACSASDRQGSNFESCVWRTVSSQSSHHPQEVLLAQFSLYVHKGGLKPDSFHFIYDNRPCAANLVWDDKKKICARTSITCKTAKKELQSELFK